VRKTAVSVGPRLREAKYQQPYPQDWWINQFGTKFTVTLQRATPAKSVDMSPLAE